MIYEILPEYNDEKGSYVYRCSCIDGETAHTNNLTELLCGGVFRTSSRSEAFKAITFLGSNGRITSSELIAALGLFCK